MNGIFKIKIKKAHLFTVLENRNRFSLPKIRKRQKSMWQQVYTLLF